MAYNNGTMVMIHDFNIIWSKYIYKIMNVALIKCKSKETKDKKITNI